MSPFLCPVRLLSSSPALSSATALKICQSGAEKVEKFDKEEGSLSDLLFFCIFCIYIFLTTQGIFVSCGQEAELNKKVFLRFHLKNLEKAL